MKTYSNKEQAETAINILRNAMWRILNRLTTEGYDGDWQHAEDIEFVGKISDVVHSSRSQLDSESVNISEEAYERLSKLTLRELSSVMNRKTRPITAKPATKPQKMYSDADQITLQNALMVILDCDE